MEKEKQTNHYVDNVEFHKAMLEFKNAVVAAEAEKQPRPRVPEYIAKCFMDIAKHLSYKPNFINYCVDESTEALTTRGWVSQDQITTDDIILSCDPDTFRMCWSPIHEIYHNNVVNEKMFKITGCGLDAFVTEGHKWLTVESGLVPTESLRVKDHIITMGSESLSGSGSHSDAFVQLVGWAATEGYYSMGKTKHSVRIAQKHAYHIETIRKCLFEYNKGEMNWKEYTQDNNVQLFHITGQLANDLIAAAPTPRKVLSSDFILSLAPHQRHLLITTMIDGDGWYINRSSGTVARQYVQKDKDHVDAFVMLCALSGIATTTVHQKRQTPFGVFDGFTVTLRDKTQVYCDNLDFHGGKVKLNRWGKRRHQPTVDYSGIVWCPKTDYGTFVARRNGRVYVTGNTYRDDMISDGIENCLQYIDNYDPVKSNNPFAYFTQIIWYAFLRRIQKEKKQQYVKYKQMENLDIEHIIETEGRSQATSDILNDQSVRNDFINQYEEGLREQKEKARTAKKQRAALEKKKVELEDN